MCGRYSLIAELEELAPRFEFDPADFADQPQTRTLGTMSRPPSRW